MTTDGTLEVADGLTVGWRPAASTDRRLASRALVRSLLPVDARGWEITQRCAVCGGSDHGGLRVGDDSVVRAGVTYARQVAVAVVADASAYAAVGIDAEPMHDRRRDRVGLEGVLAPGAPATVREWVRVEAVLKADGRGLRVDPGRVRTTGVGDTFHARIDGGDPVYSGFDLTGPTGLVLSVAVLPL